MQAPLSMPEPSNQPACKCLLKALQARVVANYLADLGCPGLVAVALVVCGGAEGDGDALMGLGHPLHLKFMWHVIQRECAPGKDDTPGQGVYWISDEGIYGKIGSLGHLTLLA